MLRSIHRIIALAVPLISAIPANSEQRVVIDYWWLNDYAKESCRDVWLDAASEKRRQACLNLDLETGKFRSSLETKLAVDPRCNGILFSKYSSTGQAINDRPKPAEHPTTLIIDYVPGEESNSWTIVQNMNLIAQGVGTLNEVTRTVCSAITKRGGKVLP